MTMQTLSNTRLIISGNRAEVYEYEKPPFPALTHRKRDKQYPTSQTTSTEKYQLQVYYKARKQIKRLYHCNFTDEPSKFITLLFDDKHMQASFDIKACKIEFDKFMKRIRRRYPDVKYIAIAEFQDKNNRGALHFHIITNLPYIPHTQLQEMWCKGYVSISEITEDTGTGEKLSHYLTKRFNDSRLKGCHFYFRSRNLKAPLILEGEDAEEVIQQCDLYNQSLVRSDAYETKFQGKVSYQEYILSQEIENI